MDHEDEGAGQLAVRGDGRTWRVRAAATRRPPCRKGGVRRRRTGRQGGPGDGAGRSLCAATASRRRSGVGLSARGRPAGSAGARAESAGHGDQPPGATAAVRARPGAGLGRADRARTSRAPHRPRTHPHPEHRDRGGPAGPAGSGRHPSSATPPSPEPPAGPRGSVFARREGDAGVTAGKKNRFYRHECI